MAAAAIFRNRKTARYALLLAWKWIINRPIWLLRFM